MKSGGYVFNLNAQDTEDRHVLQVDLYSNSRIIQTVVRLNADNSYRSLLLALSNSFQSTVSASELPKKTDIISEMHVVERKI